MAEAIDIMAAIRQIAAERKIDAKEILEAIKEAMKIGFKQEYDLEDNDLEVEIDPEEGHIAVYANKTVVKKVENEKVQISLKEAKEIDDSLELEDTVLVDITPEGDFGRIVASAAKQVISQKLRESEKEAAISEVKSKIGTIESVTIQRILPEGDILCEVNRARAIMPKDERIPTEFYQLGSRVKVLLQSLEEDERGKYIQVSRASNDFLKELFRIEVPEIDSGSVEIVSIAREAGSRSKVAVRSNSEGIDPIGSCVGQKGVRINAIMNELKMGEREEKVDIILWDEDAETYLLNAIRPADGKKVEIDEKENTATITVPADQQSLAIGREGQNSRLAEKLTGWVINIVGEDGEEVTEETIKENDDDEITEDESEAEESKEESDSEQNEDATEEVEQKDDDKEEDDDQEDSEDSEEEKDQK